MHYFEKSLALFFQKLENILFIFLTEDDIIPKKSYGKTALDVLYSLII